MERQDIEAVSNFFRAGQFSGAELVIGLVGAVGTGLWKVVADLKGCLQHYVYEVEELHVSDAVIPAVVEIPDHDRKDEYSRITHLMDAGNKAREETEDNSVLALGAASVISGNRSTNENEQPLCRPKHAYIINSLKHPDEVKVLRHIYGDGFFLIGVHADPERRKEYLTGEKKMTGKQAEELIKRDEAEDKPFGQRTRDTFYLADFFVHLDANEDRRRKSLQRILNLIFGHPYRTPIFDEFAMFMAFCAALRSSDLSRQVGAVIAQHEEILAMGGNDCPRFGGGLYWPYWDPNTGEVEDHPNGRDHKREMDSNDQEKARIINEVLEAIRGHVMSHDDSLRKALLDSPIDDITEYGRVVHAEMEALLACARSSISCRGATLYCTTFPCHNCAKHIIAAGIERVVYIEPYPKSKALEFHDDSASLGFRRESPREPKVAFEPFVGVGPRRFFDLFSMKHGSGFPLDRKNEEDGKILPWEEKHGTLRMPMLPWAYLQREEIAADTFKGYGRQLGK